MERVTGIEPAWSAWKAEVVGFGRCFGNNVCAGRGSCVARIAATRRGRGDFRGDFCPWGLLAVPAACLRRRAVWFGTFASHLRRNPAWGLSWGHLGGTPPLACKRPLAGPWRGLGRGTKDATIRRGGTRCNGNGCLVTFRVLKVAVFVLSGGGYFRLPISRPSAIAAIMRMRSWMMASVLMCWSNLLGRSPATPY